MDREARLTAALAAAAAPPRDPAFTLAILRAAEQERYRLETIRSVLKGAGLAAAIASLAMWLPGWAVSHAPAVQTGLMGATTLMLAVAAIRLAAGRVTAMLRL